MTNDTLSLDFSTPCEYHIPQLKTLLKGKKTQMLFHKVPNEIYYQWNNRNKIFLCWEGLSQIFCLDYKQPPETILFQVTCEKPRKDNYYLKLFLKECSDHFAYPAWLNYLLRTLHRQGHEYLYLTEIKFTY